MIENRETVRYPHEHRVSYCAAHDLLPRSGRLSNISRDGACLLTREPFEPNQRLTLSVPFQETDHPLTVTGSVRWLESGGSKRNQFAVGLRWLPLDQRSDALLEELIEWKTQNELPLMTKRRSWSDWKIVREIRTTQPGGLLALALFLVSYGFSLALFSGYQRDRALRMEDAYDLKQTILVNETLRLQRNMHQVSKRLGELRASHEGSLEALSALGLEVNLLGRETESLAGLRIETEDTARSAESRKERVDEKLTTLQRLLTQ